jgi:hypothetical protein
VEKPVMIVEKVFAEEAMKNYYIGQKAFQEPLIIEFLNSLNVPTPASEDSRQVRRAKERTNEKKIESTPSLSDDTLEKMKDILYSVETLFKKLKSENLFSTNSDDNNE